MAQSIAVEPTINGFKVTVHFSRKVSDGNYGGTEAAVWVEGTLPENYTAAEVAAEAARLFQPARAAVYDELDIATELDEGTGLLRELATPFRSNEQAERAVDRKMGQSTKVISVFNPQTRKWEADNNLPEWVTGPAAKHGIDRIFRQTKKDDNTYVYYKEGGNNANHGENGQPFMFWPPKD